jgi:glucose/arabinose dehydrogenase
MTGAIIKKGKIYLFEDWDDAKKQFKKNTVFAENLHNPNQVMFYTDNGIHGIYTLQKQESLRVTNTARVIKHCVAPGRYSQNFPITDSIINTADGTSHGALRNTMGKIYVSVGSSCNACIEKEEIRASIVEMNPDGSPEQKTYATGVRNAVGIKWINNQLMGYFYGDGI